MRRLGLSLTLLIGGCGGVSLSGTSSGGCDGNDSGEQANGATSVAMTGAVDGQAVPGESTAIGQTPNPDPALDAVLPDEPAAADAGTVEPEEPGADTTPGETLSAPASEVDPAPYPTSTDDPLAYPAFGPEYAPDLLSLYMDALTIGMMGSTGGVNTYTYLEQLCIDGGAPEYYCRQLYADDYD